METSSEPPGGGNRFVDARPPRAPFPPPPPSTLCRHLRRDSPRRKSPRINDLGSRIDAEARAVHILEAELSLLAPRLRDDRRSDVGDGSMSTLSSGERRRRRSSDDDEDCEGEGPLRSGTGDDDDVSSDGPNSGDGAESDDDDSAEGLLGLLAALQTGGCGRAPFAPPSTSTPPSLLRVEGTWHDDPDAHRLHPILTGVAFTKVVGPTTATSALKEGGAVGRRHEYDLWGHILRDPLIVYPSSAAAIEYRPLAFRVRATVAFGRGDGDERGAAFAEKGGPPSAWVEAVKVSFSRCGGGDGAAWEPPFPAEELAELSSVASASRSLPRLFRDLEAFASFDERRAVAVHRFLHAGGGCGEGENYGQRAPLEVVSSCTLRIIAAGGKECGKKHNNDHGVSSSMENGGKEEEQQRWRTSPFSMLLSWRWRFTLLGRGEEELTMLECARPGVVEKDGSYVAGDGLDLAEIDHWMKVVRGPVGLRDLVACKGGCEGALETLLSACTTI